MFNVILILLPVLSWFIWSYNRLVRDRVRVETGWSDIGVQLKRRHDLIPKLVTAVKEYASYESATLEAIIALRNNASEPDDATSADQAGISERAIATALKQLSAVAEQDPDLKANKSYLDLQKNLTNVEHHLQFARRYYNGAVRNLNIRIDSFPDLFIARALGFRKAIFFEFEDVTEGEA